jgi:type I restriction enzyme S subunit
MNQIWENTKLKELVEFRTGKLNSNAAVLNGKYPFFTCAQETYRTNTFSFDTECVLLAGNNANGVYPLKYFIGKFDAYQRTYVITPKNANKLSTRFLYYQLQPRLEYLRSISTGAATKFLTLNLLNEIDIPIPAIYIQKKIVSILSAYDDLIENNTRRIRILEEMAQAIYREWFVNFRFPGHEGARMVESGMGRIPEGWEVRSLGEMCNVVMGQSPESKYYNLDKVGLPFHQGVTDFGTRFPRERVYCTELNRIAKEGDILFSVRAPVGRLNITRRKIVIGRGLSVIRSMGNNQVFLFQQLKEKFKEEDMMGGGTIFKAVTKDEVLGIKMIVPTPKHIDGFEKMVNPIFRLLEIIADKNENLRGQHDLLLPRLVSGELQLSDF